MPLTGSGQQPSAEGSFKSPRVSVIVPTYNTAHWLHETLDSVFAQTFADMELIVVNDGSPDTPELELMLQRYLPNILYLRQENRGPAAARNLGIRHARGEFLAFLDSDDLWLPEYLARQMRLFEEQPSIDMVYSDTRLFGNSRFAGRTFMELHPQSGTVTLESLLCGHCTIVTSCVVVRKKNVVEIGMFDENLLGPEDLDLWLRLAHGGARITYQQEVLGRRRIHAGALTWARERMEIEQEKALKKLAVFGRLDGEARLLLERRLRSVEIDLESRRGKRRLLSGDLPQAVAAFKRTRSLLNEDRPVRYQGRPVWPDRSHALKVAKLEVVLLGLNFSPHLTRYAAKLWEKFDRLLERGRTALA